MHTWVIGGGGLYGSALIRQAEQSFATPNIPWHDPEAALRELSTGLNQFHDAITDDWCIAWAAGRVTTSSPENQAAQELQLFSQFMAQMQEHIPPGNGVFMLTSSAGGVYAGSQSPPFNADTPPEPRGAYGQLKLDQERIAQSALEDRVPLVITRISNLYGPGQDLGKLQGLISRLALASITKKPLSMFVPLDTLRDYIQVDDAAKRALYWAQRTCHSDGPRVTKRVIASGESTSLGHIISLMQDVARVRIPITYGIHSSAADQARDLRLTPDTNDAIQSMPRTQLPEGMRQVYLDILRRHATSVLSS